MQMILLPATLLLSGTVDVGLLPLPIITTEISHSLQIGVAAYVQMQGASITEETFSCC